MFVCHCQDVELGGQSRSPATWDPAQEGWRAEGGETSATPCCCKLRSLSNYTSELQPWEMSQYVWTSPQQQEKRVTFEDEVKNEGKSQGSLWLCSDLGVGSCSLKTQLLFPDSPRRWQTQATGPGSWREQVSSTKTSINIPIRTRFLVASDTELISI